MSVSVLSLALSVTTPSAVVYFEYTTTRLSSGSHFSHVLLFCVFLFLKRYSFVVVCGGLVSFLFVVAPSLAVFEQASVFNQDLSKWNTGAVTTMAGSKCTLSPSLWPRLPLLCILNIRQLEFHQITILTRFVLFGFVFLKRYFWSCLWWVGLPFSLMHPLLQCFITHLRSIRTCPNGIRVR